MVVGIEKKTKEKGNLKVKVDSKAKMTMHYSAKVNEMFKGSLNAQYHLQNAINGGNGIPRIGIYMETTL